MQKGGGNTLYVTAHFKYAWRSAGPGKNKEERQNLSKNRTSRAPHQNDLAFGSPYFSLVNLKQRKPSPTRNSCSPNSSFLHACAHIPPPPTSYRFWPSYHLPCTSSIHQVTPNDLHVFPAPEATPHYHDPSPKPHFRMTEPNALSMQTLLLQAIDNPPRTHLMLEKGWVTGEEKEKSSPLLKRG